MRPISTDVPGPFDIIGDVHGCSDELVDLLGRLGYEPADGAPFQAPIQATAPKLSHPDGRRIVFLGDLVDRGPDVAGVLRLVMQLVEDDRGLCVAGNHDDKLRRALLGRPVQVKHGLAQSLEQLDRQRPRFRSAVLRFLEALPSHHVLDEGRLVVAHAGLPDRFHGSTSSRARDFALFGAVAGGTDAYGLPVRLDWTADHRGESTVVYGHTPVLVPEWRGRTIDIDTGCVFGGALTALRYPERDLVSVPARREYVRKGGPFRRFGPGGPPIESPRDGEAADDPAGVDIRVAPTG
jgi:protein phosphatase